MHRNHLIPLAALAGVITLSAWTMEPNVSLASDDGVSDSPAIEASFTAQDEDPYPLRKKYPNLKCITTEELVSMRATSIIIDARNTVEYDVIRIDGAISVPASSMKRPDLLKVRAADGETPLIFYCNGVTCTKSYKGCEKARSFGFENIYVYDAGVMAWARANPADTVFFGEPMSAKTIDKQIISKDRFKAASLDTKAFIAQAKAKGWKLYDLRDRDERSKNPIKIPGIIKCDIDQFVGFLNKPGVVPTSNILVMDWVGKQVKWVQYYLDRKGHTDYHFLSGGIKQWIADGYDERGEFVGKPVAK
jgi:rhodanese-related sulfurtransferase